jgi:hypothetical protein
VPAAKRNLNRFGGDHERSRVDHLCNIEIAGDLRRRAPDGVPPDVNRVVISRWSADRRCGTARLVIVNMPMDKRCTRRMIEVVRVDVGEGRLIEAQKQSERAKDCARNPHEYKLLYQIHENQRGGRSNSNRSTASLYTGVPFCRAGSNCHSRAARAASGANNFWAAVATPNGVA